jgi:hypothetical protein
MMQDGTPNNPDYSFWDLPPYILSCPLPHLHHLQSSLGQGVAIIMPPLGRVLLVYIPLSL